MKTKLRLVVIPLLVVSNFFSVAAQDYMDEDEVSLFAKIYCLIQRKEPKWGLEKHGHLSNTFMIGWVSRIGRASVSADIFSSAVEAKEAMKSRVTPKERDSGDTFNGKTTIIALKGFGEESYKIINNRRRSTIIMFRKGRYLIDVSGQTENIARRFARHVDSFLPPLNNSLNLTP